jgi:hypothetical protein
MRRAKEDDQFRSRTTRIRSAYRVVPNISISYCIEQFRRTSLTIMPLRLCATNKIRSCYHQFECAHVVWDLPLDAHCKVYARSTPARTTANPVRGTTNWLNRRLNETSQSDECCSPRRAPMAMLFPGLQPLTDP